MYAGITATRQGLTEAQLRTLRQVLTSPKLRIVRVTHGDAIGGDAQAHALCLELGLEVHLRPADHPDRAHCQGATVVHPPLPPLERNDGIATDGWLLIACPAGFEEEERSGTWATVRRARRPRAPDEPHNKGVIIIWPDGRHKSEVFAPGPRK